jgi:hypothetical protein
LTDIALTEQGSEAARALAPLLAGFDFSLVLSSPLQRATATCQLAGLGDSMRLEPDLVEWNYGDYEGMTSQQIEELSPGWLVFNDGCPGGESPDQVGERVDRVIHRVRSQAEERVALFAHGHVLRVFVARWLGFGAKGWCPLSIGYIHSQYPFLLQRGSGGEMLECGSDLMSGWEPVGPCADWATGHQHPWPNGFLQLAVIRREFRFGAITDHLHSTADWRPGGERSDRPFPPARWPQPFRTTGRWSGVGSSSLDDRMNPALQVQNRGGRLLAGLHPGLMVGIDVDQGAIETNRPFIESDEMPLQCLDPLGEW